MVPKRVTGAEGEAPFQPLPFDFVLFVNSAAPAIYAKMLRDYLRAYTESQKEIYPERMKRPLIVSLTSSADTATRVVHRIGNCLVRFGGGLRQNCYDYLFAKPAHGVPQYTFFDRTPGHHPALVSYWVVKDSAAHPDIPREEAFSWNITNRVGPTDPFVIRTKGRGGVRWWKIADLNSERSRLEKEGWFKPLGNQVPDNYQSAYWIIRCDKEIISGHNDYWNDAATDLYAALYRSACPPGGSVTPATA